MKALLRDTSKPCPSGAIDSSLLSASKSKLARPHCRQSNRLPSVTGRPATPPASTPSGLSVRTLGIVAGAILTIGAVGYAVLGRSERSGQMIATTASIHRQLTFTGKETVPTLSSDGRRVAYVSNESPHRKVMVQEVDRRRDRSRSSERPRPGRYAGRPTVPS